MLAACDNTNAGGISGPIITIKRLANAGHFLTFSSISPVQCHIYTYYILFSVGFTARNSIMEDNFFIVPLFEKLKIHATLRVICIFVFIHAT